MAHHKDRYKSGSYTAKASIKRVGKGLYQVRSRGVVIETNHRIAKQIAKGLRHSRIKK